jgi:hypothetical protein
MNILDTKVKKKTTSMIDLSRNLILKNILMKTPVISKKVYPHQI